MKYLRLTIVLSLALFAASCASKAPVGTEYVFDEPDVREKVDPELADPSPHYVGESSLTAQEFRALNYEGKIKFSKSAYAKELITEQFLFLERDVRFKINNWTQRGARYLPHARQVFAERGLPEDLIYLPFIESGYNPKAYSKSGAAGCWQFMPFTGRRFGLSVDWWMDERRDPYKAAHAAADYLTKLHDMFDDWSLAVAAYNAGEGKVGRALKASGAKDFFELAQRNNTLDQKTRLRDETLAYVPRFAAMVKIANNLQLLGLEPINWSAAPRLTSISIPGGTDLRGLAKASNMSWNDFQNYNPAFRRETTPPARKATAYVPLESLASVEKYTKSPISRTYDSALEYTVRRGDSWSVIASRYNVDMSTLKRINGRTSNLLHPGQRIIIPGHGQAVAVRKEKAATPQRSTKVSTRKSTKVSTQASASTGSYRVRAGDTLYSLARRFGCNVSDLQRANGLNTPRALNAGAVINIPGSSSRASRQVASAATPSRTVYRVQHGDTLWSIARNFRVSPYKLMEWNSLQKNSVIKPGDQISLYRK